MLSLAYNYSINVNHCVLRKTVPALSYKQFILKATRLHKRRVLEKFTLWQIFFEIKMSLRKQSKPSLNLTWTPYKSQGQEKFKNFMRF